MEKINIIDIETFKQIFYLGYYDITTKEKGGFEISSRVNQIDNLVKWYLDPATFTHSVTYNGVGFDCPVIEYIMDNYKYWYDLTGDKICMLISDYAQKVIDDKNHGITLYRESQFSKPTYDPFTILGLNNMNRWTSLKACEYYLDLPNIEELPYPWDSDMTSEMMDELIDYCHNDIYATYMVYKLTCGDTENPIYKDNNQIELRKDIQEEFGIECKNLSDLHIGRDIMKKSYAEATNTNISDLPKKGTFRKSIKIKNCIPKYIKFKTQPLKDLLSKLKGMEISQFEGIDEIITIGNTKHQLAKGGLHAINSSECYYRTDTLIIEDDDVALRIRRN